MAFNLPFAVSEILIGSDKNKIFITNTGDMIFVDGSLAGTDFENGITLAQLANIDGSISLDDLMDVSDVEPNKSYLLFRNPDNTWKAVEFTPPDTVVEELNDINDVTAPNPNDGDVLVYSNGQWRNEAPPSSIETAIIQVEPSDWTADATLIDGDPGYFVSVPHNFGLSLPADLLEVSVWNMSNERITVHKVQQQENAVYLESTVNLELYVVMRKV